MILGITGHRPGRLALPRSQAHLVNTYAEIRVAELVPDKVITGMALGWDQAVAEACAHLGVPFIAAVPFDGFEAEWEGVQQVWYRRLLAKAERVEVVSPGSYDRKKLMKRNEWIVNNSNEMLALWDGYDNGGTASCVRYALKQGIKTTNVWLDWRGFLRTG